MNSPNRRTYVWAAVIAVLALVVPGVASSQPGQLRIESIVLGETQIVITGQNFGGVLEVTVGESVVNVSESSEVNISADKPALEAGTYVVQVTRDGGLTPETIATSTLLVK